MRTVILTLFLLLCCGAQAADAPTPVAPRISLFSTSTDWAAVAGLSWGQYTGKIISDKNLVGNLGLILYYLDGFPCYGEADSVRVWISPSGKMHGHLRLVCVHAPTEIKFAWRNAKQDADQRATTGVLTCPVTGQRDFTVDLGKCVRGKNWQEYR